MLIHLSSSVSFHSYVRHVVSGNCSGTSKYWTGLYVWLVKLAALSADDEKKDQKMLAIYKQLANASKNEETDWL